jgi:hypothetical protein
VVAEVTRFVAEQPLGTAAGRRQAEADGDAQGVVA